jgi:hypothetical protein
MSEGNPDKSRWTDGSIQGMAPNCSYPGYKGSGHVKGIARRLRQMKHFEAEARNELTDPRNRASFRRLSEEAQIELLEKLGEPVLP